MELRHLRYFVAVAEELHFGRAANRLHVAQPAVSEQVRKLELELGVQLFNRNPGAVSLTAGGVALLDEARRVLQQAEVAAYAARNAQAGARMRLRVAYLPDALPRAVSRALRHLATSAPKVSVELEAGPARRLVDDLHLGRLDAVVTSLPTATGKARVTPIGHQRAVAALPAAHPQATGHALVLEWVARTRLIVLPAEANPAFRSAVVAQCRAAGLSPEFAEVARIEDALLAVTAGSGIALFPESVAERHVAPGIRFLPLRNAEPAFETAVLTMPGMENLATKTFLRAISHAVAAQPSDPAPALRGRALAQAPRA